MPGSRTWNQRWPMAALLAGLVVLLGGDTLAERSVAARVCVPVGLALLGAALLPRGDRALFISFPRVTRAFGLLLLALAVLAAALLVAERLGLVQPR